MSLTSHLNDRTSPGAGVLRGAIPVGHVVDDLDDRYEVRNAGFHFSRNGSRIEGNDSVVPQRGE